MPLFRRRPRVDEDAVLEKVPDDLPRDDLFTQPLRVDAITVREIAEVGAGDTDGADGERIRVAFRVVIRDADDKRCPDLAVEATIRGPERTATGMTQTDLMGAVLFRMTGPPGTYRIHVDDVAAGALTFDEAASTLDLTVDA